MRITQCESRLLRVPLSRPINAPNTSDRYGKMDHVHVLVVHVDTDAGHRGLGFAYSLQGGGRALKVLLDDDIAPIVLNEDPLDHERLWNKAYWKLQSIGRRGLVMQAYSAIDLALWDLKGKAAGLPLYKLLGGAREATPAYGSDTGWLWMSTDEVLAASRGYIDQGLMGIKLKVGGQPQEDADRLSRVREILGDEIWLGVDANQRYDYNTALAMGHFYEEEIGVDWFEEPMSCEDLDGHRRLADKLEVPIALGESLFGLDEFERYLTAGAVDIVQPDLTRVGGLTPFLKIAALVERQQRAITPHLLPEVSVHLACGLPHVMAVEYMPWLSGLFVEPPAIVQGKLVPPKRPGLGLETNADVLEKYRVSV